MTITAPLAHGGDIISATKDTGIAFENWIDLSTGISPYAYPTNDIPPETFSNLPYIDQSFNDSVKGYYGSEQFVALPGTQSAIQVLPSLLDKLPVLLPSVGYQEHKQAWHQAGNPIDYYPAFDATTAFDDIELKLKQQPLQHLLIINPNNPSTLSFSPQQLDCWAQTLDEGGYLIVDEAFIDTSSSQSILPYLADRPRQNIIVLRSFGKFFGLAGIRLGFVFAAQEILEQFKVHLPLWSINGPALHLAKSAFSDSDWQTEHLAKLVSCEQFTSELFKPLEHEQCFHQRLFSSYVLPKKLALTLFERFYQAGILLRLIAVSEDTSIIRIGRIQAEDKLARDRISAILTEHIAQCAGIFSTRVTTRLSAKSPEPRAHQNQ